MPSLFLPCILRTFVAVACFNCMKSESCQQLDLSTIMRPSIRTHNMSLHKIGHCDRYMTVTLESNSVRKCRPDSRCCTVTQFADARASSDPSADQATHATRPSARSGSGCKLPPKLPRRSWPFTVTTAASGTVPGACAGRQASCTQEGQLSACSFVHRLARGCMKL